MCRYDILFLGVSVFMGQILVFGNGNLGRDIILELDRIRMPWCIRSNSRDEKHPLFDDTKKPSLIINTVGGCPRMNFSELWEKNVEWNKAIAIQNPNTPLLAFSSNATLEAWRTPYSASKIALEKLAESSHNLFVARVGTLYGKHLPLRTFPGKLKNNYPNPCKLTLPNNPIQPTPTSWLAWQIIMKIEAFMEGPKVLDMAPSGKTTFFDWGKSILGDDYEITSHGLDEKYNNYRLLSSKGNTSWERLWNLHKLSM